MTQPPTPQEVKVATNALRTEATEWETQGVAIATAAATVGGMELGRVEAGLFQLIVSPYNAVVDAVQSRCQEARTAMEEIADTLRTVANTYDEEDQNNAHRIRNLY